MSQAAPEKPIERFQEAHEANGARQSEGNKLFLGFFLTLLGVLMFGGTLPFTKLALIALDPWFITSGRAVLAGILALIVLLLLKRPVPSRVDLRDLALASLFLVLGFPLFMAFGVQRVEASHGAVVLGVLPLLTAMISAWWLKERPSIGFWIVAVIGAMIVVGFSLAQGGGHLQWGDVSLFIAALSASAGYVISARLSKTMPGWEVISWACVLALPILLPIALYTRPESIMNVPYQAVIGFLYAGVVSQYLGFFAWNAGLALGGVARMSQVQLLQTFFTFFFATLMNGENIPLNYWLIAALVLSLVLMGQRLRISTKK